MGGPRGKGWEGLKVRVGGPRGKGWEGLKVRVGVTEMGGGGGGGVGSREH